MQPVYIFRDVISRRRHRKCVVVPTRDELLARLHRVGYARSIIRSAANAVYDFFNSTLYHRDIARRINPEKISKSVCGQIFDILIIALITELCSTERAGYHSQLAASEFCSISDNIFMLQTFAHSYEQALLSDECTFAHTINYLARQRLIPGLTRYDSIHAAVLTGWMMVAKVHLNRMADDLEKLHSAIRFGVSDFFPPTLQAIVEAHRIDAPTGCKIECDVLLPLDTLGQWARAHCSEAAADPGNRHSNRFSFYYWANAPGIQHRSVEPLPDEFLELIGPDLIELLEKGRAVAWCHDCRNYCPWPEKKVSTVNQVATVSDLETGYFCQCGKLLWATCDELRIRSIGAGDD